MTIEELKRRKNELGITYEELAEKSGISLSAVQKIMGGQVVSPKYDTMNALERVLFSEGEFGKKSESRPEVSIGNQDFGKIIENRYFYEDKTEFIKQWWESGDVVTLITRPRRFGKTLNMSMLDYFFSNRHADSTKLFEKLKIWKYDEYRELQGQFPVVAVSFASVKGNDYVMSRQQIVQEIVRLYRSFSDILEQPFLTVNDRKFIDLVGYDMSDAVATASLNFLCEILARFYGKRVIVILDEYDTPLQEAYVSGFWDEMTNFIRNLFNSTFKTNNYLERGIMTGITRVSKESIFSDLNNLKIVSLATSKYETAFGFTKSEVDAALKVYGLFDKSADVRSWYDGFRVGNEKEIYNPWSVTQFLDTGILDDYWANTSANLLIEKLIREGTANVKEELEKLLNGGQTEALIDEEIVFDMMDKSESGIFSMLLASGYLKVDEITAGEGMRKRCLLSLTNLEVLHMFEDMIRRWFEGADTRYNDFIKALLSNDLKYMNRFMNEVALNTFSSFDSGNKPSERNEPERFYHGFVLGLIVDLRDRYLITSNRESGFGRYDVCLEPRDINMPAYVLEFKVHDPDDEKSLEDTVKNALKQIEERQYDTDLLARGISKENIYHYGFAFKGKTVLIG